MVFSSKTSEFEKKTSVHGVPLTHKINKQHIRNSGVVFDMGECSFWDLRACPKETEEGVGKDHRILV